MTTILALPGDVQLCFLGHLHNICIVSLTVLADTNKFYYRLISLYAQNFRGTELFLCRHVNCNAYALKGYFGLLKEYFTKDSLKTSDICRHAAEGGHLEILKWAQSKSCPLNGIRTANVAENGHHEVLKWAIEYGCKRSPKICYFLVKQGNLEMLYWAITNGCIYKSFEDIYVTACEYGHLDIILWARQNRFKGYKYIKPRARVKWPDVDFDKY
jgi:hypothetical protein